VYANTRNPVFFFLFRSFAILQLQAKLYGHRTKKELQILID